MWEFDTMQICIVTQDILVIIPFNFCYDCVFLIMKILFLQTRVFYGYLYVLYMFLGLIDAQKRLWNQWNEM